MAGLSPWASRHLQPQSSRENMAVTFPTTPSSAPARNRFRRRRPAAFSLVEVVISLGVLAFTSVGLFGLLSLGLGHFRTAVDVSTASQISQRVVADLQQMEFDTLLDAGANTAGDFYTLPERGFDEQGSEIVPADPDRPTPEESRQMLYRVRIRVAKPGVGDVAAQNESGFTSLPALDGAPRFQLRDTVYVTIQIVNNPGNREIPTDQRLLWSVPAANVQNCAVVTSTAIVTRNGYRGS